MGRSYIRGEQVKDESIDSEDLASGSIKAGELSAESVSGQTLITSTDTTNDRLLIWDATDSALKQVSPGNLGLGGGGSVAGSDTQVQYNNGGSFGGASKLLYDDSNHRLGIGSTTAPSNTLTVYADVSNAYVATIDNDQASAGHVLKLSTDGNGSGSRLLEMEDGDGDILFRARADGRFGFGPDGVDSMGAGTFVVGIDNSSHTADIAISQRLQHLGDSNTYLDFPSNDNITFAAGGSEELKIASDSVLVKQYIKHDGDEDTFINFTDDKIVLKAGNKAMITTEEKSSAPHEVTINDGGNNVDFVVKGNGSNGGNPGMKFDASTNKLGINGVGTPSYELTVAGDIGLDEYIYHNGDDDTYIQFGDDQMILHAGGRSMLKLEEAVSAQDKLIVNHGALDIDFQVKGENAANLIRTDAELDTVGINTNTPKSTLSVAGSLAFNVTVIGSSNDPGTTYTVVATDCVILVNTRPTAQGGIDSALTITMPGVSDYPGRVVIIKDAGGYSQTNAITIQGAGSDNFEGNPSTTSIQHSSDAESITLISNGDSSWYKI
jgi:hypothetical protein